MRTPPATPIPSHREGIGDGSANSVLIPKQYGPIAEWINKHIRSAHMGFGGWPMFRYIVSPAWTRTGWAEGTVINTYTGTKIYSNLQAAIDGAVAASDSDPAIALCGDSGGPPYGDDWDMGDGVFPATIGGNPLSVRLVGFPAYGGNDDMVGPQSNNVTFQGACAIYLEGVYIEHLSLVGSTNAQYWFHGGTIWHLTFSNWANVACQTLQMVAENVCFGSEIQIPGLLNALAAGNPRHTFTNCDMEGVEIKHAEAMSIVGGSRITGSLYLTGSVDGLTIDGSWLWSEDNGEGLVNLTGEHYVTGDRFGGLSITSSVLAPGGALRTPHAAIVRNESGQTLEGLTIGNNWVNSAQAAPIHSAIGAFNNSVIGPNTGDVLDNTEITGTGNDFYAGGAGTGSANDDLYVRVDGTNPLTANWYPGVFQIGNFDFWGCTDGVWMGDWNYGICLHYVSGDPMAYFDWVTPQTYGDAIVYDRSEDWWDFLIADVGVARLGATGLKVDHILELTADHGLEIDGVSIKDGLVDGVDVSTLTAISILSERATQAIAAGTTVAVTDGSPLTPFTTTGNITNTAAPFIAAGREGQLVILRNDNGTGTLTISDTNIGAGGSLLRLSASTVTMAAGSSLCLEYSTIQGAWVEQYYLALVAVTPAILTHTINIGAGASNAQNAEVANAGTDTPTFAWTYTGVPSSGTVDVSAGGDVGTDYPHAIAAPYTSLTSDAFNKGTSVGTVRTFTPSIVVNGSTLTTPTATVTYINRRYMGPSTQAAALTTAQILGLDADSHGTSALSTISTGTFSVNIEAGEYLWYAYRSALRAVLYLTIQSEIAGFTEKQTDVDHTNDSGFVEHFDTWRATTAAVGSVSAVVSTSAGNNRFYMGPSTDTDPISNANILALDDTADGESGLYSTQARTWTAIKIEAGEYLWYCHPDRIDDLATIKDGTTGFAIAGSYRTNVSHTNQYGYVEDYRCWRSDNTGIYPSGENVVIT